VTLLSWFRSLLLHYHFGIQSMHFYRIYTHKMPIFSQYMAFGSPNYVTLRNLSFSGDDVTSFFQYEYYSDDSRPSRQVRIDQCPRLAPYRVEEWTRERSLRFGVSRVISNQDDEHNSINIGNVAVRLCIYALVVFRDILA
jgi:hypothetical protein